METSTLEKSRINVLEIRLSSLLFRRIVGGGMSSGDACSVIREHVKAEMTLARQPLFGGPRVEVFLDEVEREEVVKYLCETLSVKYKRAAS